MFKSFHVQCVWFVNNVALGRLDGLKLQKPFYRFYLLLVSVASPLNYITLLNITKLNSNYFDKFFSCKVAKLSIILKRFNSLFKIRRSAYFKLPMTSENCLTIESL